MNGLHYLTAAYLAIAFVLSVYSGRLLYRLKRARRLTPDSQPRVTEEEGA